MQILQKQPKKPTHFSLRQRLKFSINIKQLKYFNSKKKILRFVGDALVTGTKF